MKPILALLLASLWAAPARADRCRDIDRVVKYDVENVDGKKVIHVKTEIIVCGKPARPGVAYVLVEDKPRYVWDSLEHQLLPHILTTVKKAPF